MELILLEVGSSYLSQGKQSALTVISEKYLPYIIDSLDGFTFRNQLISILLVVPTGQHLHAIPKNVKIK